MKAYEVIPPPLTVTPTLTTILTSTLALPNTGLRMLRWYACNSLTAGSNVTLTLTLTLTLTNPKSPPQTLIVTLTVTVLRDHCSAIGNAVLRREGSP